MTAFSSFVDALRLASDEGDRSRQLRCRWAVLSDDARPIRASCGVEVSPTHELGDPAEFDYLVIVGGLLGGGRKLSPALERYLQEAAAARGTLVGVCTGSFLLARAGKSAGVISDSVEQTFVAVAVVTLGTTPLLIAPARRGRNGFTRPVRKKRRSRTATAPCTGTSSSSATV